MQHSTLSTTADTIKIHRLIAHIPAWDELDPRFVALCHSVEAHGLREPVKLTTDHRILDQDSRERWVVAKRYQLPEIPVILYSEEHAADVAISTLLHRAHYTQGQRAFLAFPMLEIAVDSNNRRRLQNLRKGQQSPESAITPIREEKGAQTLEKLAETLGMSRRVLSLARDLHKIYAADPDYREQTLVMVLADTDGGEHESRRPMSIGAAIAGHAGRQQKGHARQDATQLELWGRSLHGFVVRAKHYPRSGVERTRAFDQLVEQLDGIENEAFMEDLAKAARASKNQRGS